MVAQKRLKESFFFCIFLKGTGIKTENKTHLLLLQPDKATLGLTLWLQTTNYKLQTGATFIALLGQAGSGQS